MRSNPERFNVPVAKPVKLGPEHNVWFWNPARPQFKQANEGFVERLHKEMGEELEVTWNPVIDRWQVWSKAPRFQHPICQGWRLLFIHHDSQGGYLPLDERLFARLFEASAAKHGSAKQYIDRIQAEYWRDQDKKNKRLTQEAIDQAMPFFDHSQIKVSMRGKSNGSKFSTYHA